MSAMKSYIVEIIKSYFDSTNMEEMDDHIRKMVKEVIEDHYLGEDRIREICEEIAREIVEEEVSNIDAETLLRGTTIEITFG
jgi:uncharacterized membrane-anchored protein